MVMCGGDCGVCPISRLLNDPTGSASEVASSLIALGIGNRTIGHCVTTADPTHIEDYANFYSCYALALLLCA